MEVGAVKQAFNNEVILLKNKLNQAKIQIIHKLTRKAKMLTEKKVPEKLKLKFTKKAELAVTEVLIIKKIKPRDVAKFAVTHKGQLNEYLNRPVVDLDKACARLLLHKALQDKYKVIRERFSNISVEDLLMSRQERRKLKKEAREKQKNKNKGKDISLVPAVGNWDVEDIDIDDSKLHASENDLESSADESDRVNSEGDDESQNENDSIDDDAPKSNVFLKHNVSDTAIGGDSSGSSDDDVSDDQSRKTNDVAITAGIESSESDINGDDESAGKFVKIAPHLPDNNITVDNNRCAAKLAQTNENVSNKQVVKKHKEGNKNKNLKNKILLKNFNKEKLELPLQENKIVDPFFITATGQNYMSVAEPRLPDEVKDEHSQGNRKYRRAVMFGNVPKAKPRRDDFRPGKNNSRFSKFDNSNGNFNSSFNNSSFKKHGPQNNFDKTVDSSNRSYYNDGKSEKVNIEDKQKPEKLHPSWEAKKRQSGIVPFQGKKTVFDEG